MSTTPLPTATPSPPPQPQDPFTRPSGVSSSAILPLVLANVILLIALVGLFFICCKQHSSLPAFRNKVPHLDREGLRPADPRMLDPLQRYSRRRGNNRGSGHGQLALPNDTPTLPRYTSLAGSLVRSFSRLASFGRSHSQATVVDAESATAARSAVAAEAGTVAAPEYRTLDHDTEQHLTIAISTPLPTANTHDTLRSSTSSLISMGRPNATAIPHIPPPLAPPAPPPQARTASDPLLGSSTSPEIPILPRSASVESYALIPVGARPQLSTITERDEDVASLIPLALAGSNRPSPVLAAPATLSGGEERDGIPSVDLRMLAESEQYRRPAVHFTLSPELGHGSRDVETGSWLNGRRSV